jgi:hypothetical protein
VVTWLVSKQPPWSMEMSTSTAPGFIASMTWRVTSLGALAPGISTEPITRSAVTVRSSTVWRFDINVRMRPL